MLDILSPRDVKIRFFQEFPVTTQIADTCTATVCRISALQFDKAILSENSLWENMQGGFDENQSISLPEMGNTLLHTHEGKAEEATKTKVREDKLR